MMTAVAPAFCAFIALLSKRALPHLNSTTFPSAIVLVSLVGRFALFPHASFAFAFASTTLCNGHGCMHSHIRLQLRLWLRLWLWLLLRAVQRLSEDDLCISEWQDARSDDPKACYRRVQGSASPYDAYTYARTDTITYKVSINEGSRKCQLFATLNLAPTKTMAQHKKRRTKNPWLHGFADLGPTLFRLELESIIDLDRCERSSSVRPTYSTSNPHINKAPRTTQIVMCSHASGKMREYHPKFIS